MNRSRELAALLLRKAAQDEYALEKLAADPGAPEEIIGFHAQQAIEKMLKAVLALAAIRYPRTHDLTELLDLVRKQGFEVPPQLEDVEALSSFAVGFRYEDLPAPFDREWARSCVRATRVWAEGTLGRNSSLS